MVSWHGHDMTQPVLDIATHTLAVLARESFLLPFVAFGLMTPWRRSFADVTLIVLTGLVTLSFLAAFIEIKDLSYPAPLYVFPSGHFVGVTLVFGWLIRCVSQLWLKTLLFLFVALVGWALWWQSLQTPTDLLFGVLTAACFVKGYQILLQHKWCHDSLKVAGIALSCMCALVMAGLFYWAHIAAHVWIAFYILCGFSVANLFNPIEIGGPPFKSIGATGFLLLGIVLARFASGALQQIWVEEAAFFAPWAVVGFLPLMISACFRRFF